jgi:hypothetical protein
MTKQEQLQYYLDAGASLAGPWQSYWREACAEFLKTNGDPKLLDNVMDVMRTLNSGTTQSAVKLFNSQEHINEKMELQFIKACHTSGQDFQFHLECEHEIPGTYPARDENGDDLAHKMYDTETRWGHFDKMIEAFAQDESQGFHSCAWFNGRLYYSSTMDYNDPLMAMNGKPSPTQEEREAELRRAQEREDAMRIQYETQVRQTAPQILSAEKYQEWQNYFADSTSDIMLAYAQRATLEVVEMINRGDDLDVVRDHFNDMGLREYIPVVANFVERFSDNGQGMKDFLMYGERDGLDLSRDEGQCFDR